MRKGLKALLTRLKDELPNLMRQYSPHDNDSDYICAFCYKRAQTNVGDIPHTDSCLGKALERELPFA